ncbi:unnamed protein product [Paramecium octaurelia]|uniref:Uncharacterized protein n=1 Tax=Paramecium octaurelia TaxID=43137 RepID=A0A8S1TPS1_PAROT|nr:unnamed protein product [Paramecium octaurelia]
MENTLNYPSNYFRIQILNINDQIFLHQDIFKQKLNFKLTKGVEVTGSVNCTYYFPSKFIKSKSILFNNNG